jgi:transposase
MSKKYIVSLWKEEQEQLRAIISKRDAKAVIVKRAYILLAADSNGEGLPDEQIAKRYQVTVRTIEGIRKRFIEEGFDTVLYGKKRTVFKPRLFDGRTEAHLIALRCSHPPQGHCAWTLHLLKERMITLGYVQSISHEWVRQLLKKMN